MFGQWPEQDSLFITMTCTGRTRLMNELKIVKLYPLRGLHCHSIRLVGWVAIYTWLNVAHTYTIQAFVVEKVWYRSKAKGKALRKT